MGADQRPVNQCGNGAGDQVRKRAGNHLHCPVRLSTRKYGVLPTVYGAVRLRSGYYRCQCFLDRHTAERDRSCSECRWGNLDLHGTMAWPWIEMPITKAKSDFSTRRAGGLRLPPQRGGSSTMLTRFYLSFLRRQESRAVSVYLLPG